MHRIDMSTHDLASISLCVIILYGWLVVGIKADCLKGELSVWLGYSKGRSFYKILVRIYASFAENRGKLRMPWSTSDRGLNPALPVYQF